MKRLTRYQVTMAKRLEDSKGREITMFKSITSATKNDVAGDMLDACNQRSKNQPKTTDKNQHS
jgi:hypothetical protein